MDMFNNCSVMIIKAGTKPEEIYRINSDADTQKAICEAFSAAREELVFDKTRVEFDGSYRPHNDEFLAIEQFQLPDTILDAIRDPLGVAPYQKESDEFPEIKAIFVGERSEANGAEKFNIGFQRFRKEQYISKKWYNLFFDADTFFQEKRFGISISDSIDCYYTEGELQFTSFYFARQVFDLSSYYRSATDNEVVEFSASRKLSFEDADAFKSMANTWIRRKIAMINDSKVLSNYSAEEIKSLAATTGIEIETQEERILIPNDKEKVKVILGFLDEEAYKGPFSQITFLANSKRRVKNRQFIS